MLEILNSHYAAITAFIDDLSRHTVDARTPGLHITLSIYTAILKDAQSILLSLINYIEEK